MNGQKKGEGNFFLYSKCTFIHDICIKCMLDHIHSTEGLYRKLMCQPNSTVKIPQPVIHNMHNLFSALYLQTQQIKIVYKNTNAGVIIIVHI